MTKQTINDNVAKNNVVDKMLMGVGAFLLVMAAGHGILPYIKASQPINYMLAGGALGTLVYMIFAPMFRK